MRLIVQDVFRRYSEGETAKSILNSLLIQGFKNKGKNPTYSFITNMLKNRRYLGEYRFKDTVVENAFEPLVTKEVFDKCQKILAANKRKSAHFKKVDNTYLLTGKIFCGHCGSSMSGVSGTSKTGEVHRYYHCRNAKIKKSCSKKRVSKDFIENIVFDATMQMLNDTSLINQIVDTCYEMQNKENSSIPIMKNQLKRVEKELENMINAIKQGIITPSTKTTLMELEQEKNELEAKIAQEEIKKPILSKEQIRCWLHHFRSYKRNNETQMQKLLDVFVNAVYVYDDKMLITYNYKDGEKCVDYDEIQKYMNKKENSDNRNDYQSSPINVFGEPSAIKSELFKLCQFKFFKFLALSEIKGYYQFVIVQIHGIYKSFYYNLYLLT